MDQTVHSCLHGRGWLSVRSCTSVYVLHQGRCEVTCVLVLVMLSVVYLCVGVQPDAVCQRPWRLCRAYPVTYWWRQGCTEWRKLGCSVIGRQGSRFTNAAYWSTSAYWSAAGSDTSVDSHSWPAATKQTGSAWHVTRCQSMLSEMLLLTLTFAN